MVSSTLVISVLVPAWPSTCHDVRLPTKALIGCSEAVIAHRLLIRAIVLFNVQAKKKTKHHANFSYLEMSVNPIWLNAGSCKCSTSREQLVVNRGIRSFPNEVPAPLLTV